MVRIVAIPFTAEYAERPSHNGNLVTRLCLVMHCREALPRHGYRLARQSLAGRGFPGKPGNQKNGKP